ncbi:MAG: hypothetical protein V4456_17365 [Bacteroidota bacterium]
MKSILTLIICLVFFKSYGQEKFDAPSWKAPYTLATDGWSIERFPIPIDFAPSIPYHGVEDIRFTPGWGDAKSSDYWSYAFLWLLDAKPTITTTMIEKNLTAYYTGLVERNIGKRSIKPEQLVKIKTSIKKVSKAGNDLQTYNGTVYMLDYMAQRPITLNCIIHVRVCSGSDKLIVFHELSPQKTGAPVWERMNKLWADFSCSN